ncbi:MAG: hypothetical protein R3325_14220 [Thermoanaerobaculia bacterium]|nr:hypothetical protein [Thermoanaerobaculia bacterium]
MVRRVALVAVAAGSLLVLFFSLAGGAGASVGFTLTAGAIPFALMALGATRAGRLGTAAVPILALLAVVEGALVGMLLLRGRVLEPPWVGGLPLGAALLVYGLLLLPLAATAVGFALVFDRFDVSEDDLERLRGLAPGEGEG